MDKTVLFYSQGQQDSHFTYSSLHVKNCMKYVTKIVNIPNQKGPQTDYYYFKVQALKGLMKAT